MICLFALLLKKNQLRVVVKKSLVCTRLHRYLVAFSPHAEVMYLMHILINQKARSCSFELLIVGTYHLYNLDSYQGNATIRKWISW